MYFGSEIMLRFYFLLNNWRAWWGKCRVSFFSLFHQNNFFFQNKTAGTLYSLNSFFLTWNESNLVFCYYCFVHTFISSFLWSGPSLIFCSYSLVPSCEVGPTLSFVHIHSFFLVKWAQPCVLFLFCSYIQQLFLVEWAQP